jgi:hypothetical protein
MVFTEPAAGIALVGADATDAPEVPDVPHRATRVPSHCGKRRLYWIGPSGLTEPGVLYRPLLTLSSAVRPVLLS